MGGPRPGKFHIKKLTSKWKFKCICRPPDTTAWIIRKIFLISEDVRFQLSFIREKKPSRMSKNNQKYHNRWTFGVDQEMAYRNSRNRALCGVDSFPWEARSRDTGSLSKRFYPDYRSADPLPDYEDREPKVRMIVKVLTFSSIIDFNREFWLIYRLYINPASAINERKKTKNKIMIVHISLF